MITEVLRTVTSPFCLQKLVEKKLTTKSAYFSYMQDVVEKKLTNLAYISTKQNKADLMTKCHTFEAHTRGCAMIGFRLA